MACYYEAMCHQPRHHHHHHHHLHHAKSLLTTNRGTRPHTPTQRGMVCMDFEYTLCWDGRVIYICLFGQPHTHTHTTRNRSESLFASSPSICGEHISGTMPAMQITSTRIVYVGRRRRRMPPSTDRRVSSSQTPHWHCAVGPRRDHKARHP